jgi:adenylosuccinate synthase
MSAIVLGLGFGDEGKGLTTSFLVEKSAKQPTVIRFNGGHQAGHTVIHEGKRHVFSSFGSGTLQGIPTYWSKFCTMHPTAFMNEYHVLAKLGVVPAITAHPLCPITTPYDVAYNRWLETENINHGSVGVGFGATIQRHEDHYTLYLKDLHYPNIVMAKLRNIKLHYYPETFVAEDTLIAYMENCKLMLERVNISSEVPEKSTLIYEGAQGILLDQYHGFFPNVTRSNTTCRNIVEGGLPRTAETEVFYVTRCYQTRHGAGYMSDERSAAHLGLINNEEETNVTSPFQGVFRVGNLDVDMINYALDADSHYAEKNFKKNLMITCCDQRPGFDPKSLTDKLKVNFDKVFASYGPSCKDIKQIH